MKSPNCIRKVLASGLFAATVGAAAIQPATADALDPPAGMTVERIVLFFRHGVRAPISGEAAVAADMKATWPTWPVAPEILTTHGRDAVRLLGGYDRALFAKQHLLPATGCPPAQDVYVWTNVVQRTIATGQAWTDGLAPGCALAVQHLSEDQNDPIFDSPTTDVPFDAKAAIASITAYTGGLDRLVQSHRAAILALEEILGCKADAQVAYCHLHNTPSTLTATPDGRGLRLTGPIDKASGTAQVFLLQYAEGFPLAEVGWGRATSERIAEIGQLHAMLFDVFDRSPYMARRTAHVMGPRIVALLEGRLGGRVSVLVGHDNNIAALTSLLNAAVTVEGYAPNDPPPGGALGFELLRERSSGEAYVRLFYQAQTPDQIRNLTPLTADHPPRLQILKPACAEGANGLCRLDALKAILTFQPNGRK